MTSRERVVAALEHKEPDTVPFDLGSMHSCVETYAYGPLKEFLDLAVTKPRVRYLEPPLDMGFYLDYWPELPSRGLLKPDATREVAIAPGLNHVLWSACRHNQTAQEIEVERLVRGAFTYHFCKALRRSDGKVSRMELDSLIGVAMKRFNQIPQLEASDRELMDQPFR